MPAKKRAPAGEANLNKYLAREAGVLPRPRRSKRFISILVMATCYLFEFAAMAAPTESGTPSLAASEASNDPTVELIRAKLRQRLANLPSIDAITPIAIGGLYEVRVNRQIFYTDSAGDLFFRGEVIDTRSLKNLTQERLSQLSTIDFSQLPLKDAIVWRNGSGLRKIAVFADPNCGYCKKLEKELQSVPDVTVYTFVLSILGPDSAQKAQAVLCSKTPIQTWREWMLENKTPAASLACDNPIQRNQALAQKLRINGTPSIYFENGTYTAGFLNSNAIVNKLTTNNSVQNVHGR